MQSSKVILKPLLTEKALVGAGNREYTFVVQTKATKGEISKAIKVMFDVDTVSVKTRIVKNRSRRVLRSRQRTAVTSFKKATVKLIKDQKIDIFEVAQ